MNKEIKARVKDFAEFMVRREQLRRKKEEGGPPPWTDDPILQRFKFTNVKRLHDRTTRAFKSIYDGHRDRPTTEQFYNAALFRWFGTINFAQEIGWQSKFSKLNIQRAAERLRKRGENIFTGAYVISNFGKPGLKEDIIADILEGAWDARQLIVDTAQGTNSWRHTYDVLKTVKGFKGSGFMSKEVLQDCILMPMLENCTDRDTWTPVGPGARRGLNRIMGRDYDARLAESQAIQECLQLTLAVQVHHWPFDDMALSAHDIQFQLCEYDKMMRVKLGQGRPRSIYDADKAYARMQEVPF